jgi:hypothetical protein
MFESCDEIRNYFSDYLDGQCGPRTLRSIRYHLTYCGACRDEMDRQRDLQADIRGLRRVQVNPELALRLRVQLSQYLHHNLFDRAVVWFENALQPLLLPASVGALMAVICFGLMLGSGVTPASRIPDVPFQTITPPRVWALAPLNFSTGEQPLVVVTYVDAMGRVKDYKILSGETSPALTQQLDRMMFFSRFVPATTSGKPSEGRVVLSLRHITVRG